MINEICDEVNIKISPEPEAVVEAAPGRGVALTTDTEQGMRDTLVAPRATGAQGTTSTQPRGLYCFHSWLYFWFVPLLAPGNGRIVPQSNRRGNHESGATLRARFHDIPSAFASPSSRASAGILQIVNRK